MRAAVYKEASRAARQQSRIVLRARTYEDTIVRKMDDLLRFLRIPSISADPAFAGEGRRAPEFVRAWLDRAGLENAQLIDSAEAGAHPIVYADWLHAPGQPTLLLYGH